MTDPSPQPSENPPPAADPQSIEGLFLQALGHSAEEREAFLNEACGEDADRRRRIEALLRAYDDAGSFLEKPPVGVDTSSTLSLEFLASSDDPSLLGTLGPYEVYEVLGRGGMGIVFRARDPKLNRVVAIKVLAPELAANPNARRRFLREAQAAAAISHPHVVTIHAVDEGSAASSTPAANSSRGASSLPFIVMECIVGQTLQQKLDKQGSLRLTEILRIGHQTAQGLAAAHKQGLIHRDIKPANILLENGIERVKITDFGLARAADDVSITRTGEVSGTPQYMSPEQASGGTIDHRSDLFSLGCVMYAMCTGRSPFRATTLAAAIRRVCDDTPRPIEEINPEVPHWLIGIVNKLLAKDPEERYQSTAEVEHLLGEHLAEVQQPYSRRTPSQRFAAEAGSAAAPKPVRRAGTISSVQPVAAAPTATKPERVLIWLATLALLAPLFVLLAGLALGGQRAAEFAAITAVLGILIAVALLAVASYYRWSRAADDQRQGTTPQQLANRPPDEPTAEREDQSLPQWLVTPLPGPVQLFALLLGGIAALVMGQAIEQWSDVSGTAGGYLFVIAVLLGLLAWKIAIASGVLFRGLLALLLGVVAMALMFLGAQAPSRELKLSLADIAKSSDTLTWVTGGIALVTAWIWYCVHSATQGSNDGATSGERFGRGLVIGGIGLWAVVAVWAASIGMAWLPPPAFELRHLVGQLVMGTVVVGGLLFALGMTLARRVITPGLVHRVQTDLDSRQPSSGDAAGLHRTTGDVAAPAAWTQHDWARLLFLCGWIILIAPWLVILFGAITGNGDPMELGGSLVPAAILLSLAAFVGGAIVKFLAHKSADPPPPATGRSRGWRSPIGTLVGLILFLMTCFVVMLIMPTLARRTSDRPNGERTEVPQPAVIVPDANRNQRDADGFPPMRVIPLSDKPGTIQFQTGGNIEIGRVTIDDEDVQIQQGDYGPGGSLVEVPAEPGHRNVMVVLQSGERYHFGVNVGDDKGAVIQVPPGGEGILQVEFADPSLEIQLRRQKVVQPPRPTEMGSEMAFDPMVEMTPLDPQMRGGFGGGFGVSKPVFTRVGNSGRYRAPSGTYDVWVTDHLAGWCREGTQNPVSFSYETVTIDPGKSQTLTVRRSLRPMVKIHGGLSGFRLYDFRWNGNVQTFTRPQAQVIERLFAAYADNEPDVAATDLLASIDADPFSKEDEVDRSSAESLKVIFDDGKHPALGTMIIPGEAAESYRLAEFRTVESKGAPETPQPEVAVLQFDFTDPGLHVYLHGGTSEHSRRIGPIDDSLEDPERVAVEPGTYTVMVEDDVAGWRTKTKYGEPNAVRYEFDEITLAPGQTLDLTIDRNSYKMNAAFEHGAQQSSFLWNGQTYVLDHNQALAVARLLQARADGDLAVHEGRLLRQPGVGERASAMRPMSDDAAEAYRAQDAENGNTLRGWFDAGQHPAWETLVVAGDRPHTFRLADLNTTTGVSSAKMASLEIAMQDPGVHLYLQWKDDKKSRQEGPIDESMTLSLEPGTYTTVVEDDLAGWHTKSEFGEPGPVRYDYGQMEIAPGGRRVIGLNRNFYKMAAAIPHGLVTGSHRFRWQGESFTLDGKQAPIVAVLLKKFAEGEPDVHEGRLLAGATFTSRDIVPVPMTNPQAAEKLQQYHDDGHSLKGLFDDGKHPAWGTMIVPGEEPDTYRLAKLIEQSVPADPNASGDMSRQSPASDAAATIIGSLAPAPHERSGTLSVTIEDDGILVAVRRRSAFDGSLSANEQQVTTVGHTGLRLHPGEYVVLRRDQWFGLTDGIRQTVKIDETDVAELTFERDLNAEADRVIGEATTLLKADRTQRSCKIAWDGESQVYTAGQALVLGLLMQAYADSKPAVTAESLLTELKVLWPEGRDSLKALFDDGKHPAWGSVITANDDGTVELKHVPQGTLVVTEDSPRLTAEITPAEKNPRFTKCRVASGMKLELPPGTYNVDVEDWAVSWGYVPEDLSQRTFGHAVVDSQTVSIADGKETSLTLDRDWNDYVEPIPYGNGTTDFFRFKWFPDVRLIGSFGGGVEDSHRLNTRQARIVSRLLKGLADDKPAVAEAELLKALGDLAGEDDDGNTFESLDDVFEGLGEGKWKDLIVPGKDEGTWQLMAPAEQQNE